jgi:hypothetical protein
MEQETYRATITDVSLQGEQAFFGYLNTDNFDIEFEKTSGVVEFSVYLDVKSYGIRGIDITINKFTCTAEWYVYCEDMTEDEKQKVISYGGREYRNGNIEGCFDIDTSQPFKGKQWSIINNMTIGPTGQIFPDTVTVNLPDLSIEIS